MELPTYLHQLLSDHTRVLVVRLDDQGDVRSIDCPWGHWAVDSLHPGSPLPQPLRALLDATPADQLARLFPFVYLDDERVADVHVCAGGPQPLLVLRDVSEVHQAELRFQQKAHEVSLLLEQQEGLNRQLELANRAKSRFIASMSHEFRTPIASIMGQADLLAREAGRGELPAAIQRAAWHLLALVENLLEQARLGDGVVRLYPGVVDLRKVFEDMRRLFKAQAQAKGLELEIGAPPGDLALSTDELRLRQVLINLLGNAVRYTFAGRVTLMASPRDGWLEFKVSDTGPGIAVGDQRRVFEPFIRLDPGRQAGAGLGLAISRQLIGAMGGTLELDSEPGRGSTFHFRLALVAGAEDVPESDLRGLKVLLVDDDPDVLALYEVYLQEWGMRVTCVTGLPEALDRAAHDPLDLVFTDLYLHEGSGVGLLRQVRATQPGCTTVLCSGADIAGDWEERYGDLADAFLLKPAPPDRLRSTIVRALAASAR